MRELVHSLCRDGADAQYMQKLYNRLPYTIDHTCSGFECKSCMTLIQ